MKTKQFNNLLNELGKCDKCTNFSCSKKSLINIYKEKEFCKNIPSIDLLKSDKSNWQEIIELEKSNTKKLLNYYIKQSSNNNYSLDDIFITNAIMCARQGDSYRGNNIDLKKSTINCSEYLLKQINIIKPKVILTLGYYSLLSLSKIYNFKIDRTLKETINKYPEINVNNFVIIPLYHPVAQIKKSEQLEQYKRIWKYI